MGKNDIDQLQSFGAKIIEKNQDTFKPRKKIKQQDTKKKMDKVHIFIHIKNRIIFFQNKNKHMIKRWKVKMNAFFSPHLIKIQTFHKRHQIGSKRKISSKTSY